MSMAGEQELEMGALARRIDDLERERADLSDRVAWLEAVAEGQATLLEMRFIEVRGLAREMRRALRGAR